MPLAAKPIVGFEFVQLNVAPAILLTQSSGLMVFVAHIVTLFGVFSVGFGLTVILKFLVGPTQVLSVGVTAKLPTNGAAVKLFGAK